MTTNFHMLVLPVENEGAAWMTFLSMNDLSSAYRMFFKKPLDQKERLLLQDRQVVIKGAPADDQPNVLATALFRVPLFGNVVVLTCDEARALDIVSSFPSKLG